LELEGRAKSGRGGANHTSAAKRWLELPALSMKWDSKAGAGGQGIGFRDLAARPSD